MNPAITRRFPLIARPRPVCTPLTQRIDDLRNRATVAQNTGDATAAAAVFNLSALLASDCGLPGLARTWCRRLAHATIDHDLRQGLEPVVNLARLQVRAGNGSAAWTLLETLFRAVDNQTDIVIDGITIPASRISHAPGAHAQVRSWLWTVLLATGAQALATAGRWDEVSRHLAQYRGVGKRMLDGRQITVIAHALSGRHHQARTMLAGTQPGDRWDVAVTACLSFMLSSQETSAVRMQAALAAYQALGPEKGLAVFRTRLGLTLIDALGVDDPAALQIAAALVRDAGQDGYAARDVLAHPGCLSAATCRQARRLTVLVEECALDAAAIDEAELRKLTEALDTSEAVLARHRERTTL